MTTIASAEIANDRPAVTHALLAFTRTLRSRHVRLAATSAALRALLAVAVPCVVIAWLVPPWRPYALAVVLAVPGAAALLAMWRARRLAATHLLAVADAAAAIDRGTVERRELGELQDELATWLEHHPAAATPMRDWLGHDVHARIGRLQPAVLADVGRRRLGRLLWLLPLVLLLLFAWLLADWLSPPWAGVLGGRATQPESGQADGPGDARSAGGGGDTPQDAPQQPEPREPPPKPPPQQQAPPPPAANDEQQPAEPPAPLLDLPPQQRFVVPEFIGDGPTRRARMHAAAVDEPEAGAANAQPRGEAPANAPPPPTRAEFERAAEAALRARHVPPAEQPMVRRFFDALREAAK